MWHCLYYVIIYFGALHLVSLECHVTRNEEHGRVQKCYGLLRKILLP